MTTRQKENWNRKASFINNIGKLSVGRRTSFRRIEPDGKEHVVATVTCDTVGVRPRKFTVTSSTVPCGNGYTYKRIMSNFLDTSIFG